MIRVFREAFSLLFSGDAEVYFLAFVTLRFATFSVLISAVFSVPIGLLLAFGAFPGRKPITVLISGAMAIPTVVIGLFVFSLFSRSGVFKQSTILFTPTAVILGQALFAAPVIVSLTVSGLSRIDHRFSETMFTLSFGHRRRYLYIVREGTDEIFHALLTSYGRVVGEVGISMMLGGNIRWYTRTLTTSIMLETGKGNFTRALALGIILLVIAVVINSALLLAAAYAGQDRYVRA